MYLKASSKRSHKVLSVSREVSDSLSLLRYVTTEEHIAAAALAEEQPPASAAAAGAEEEDEAGKMKEERVPGDQVEWWEPQVVNGKKGPE